MLDSKRSFCWPLIPTIPQAVSSQLDSIPRIIITCDYNRYHCFKMIMYLYKNCLFMQYNKDLMKDIVKRL